jgi:hypothetical protein
MRTTHKFPITQHNILYFPLLARVLFAGVQDDKPYMWVELDPENSNAEREFRIYGTGHTIPDEGFWCASFQHGAYVWHLYEIKQ